MPEVTVPEILKAEATSALRRLDLHGTLARHVALRAIDRIGRLHVHTYPFDALLARIWELRSALTVYDAWDVALAEKLGTTLFTADERLTNEPGPRCDITVVTAA